MNIVRVVYKPNSGVVILHYAPKSKFSRELAFDRIMQKTGLTGLDNVDRDSSELPSTRDYRKAWEFDTIDKKVKINSTKAAQIDADKAEKEADKQALADLIKDKKEGKI